MALQTNTSRVVSKDRAIAGNQPDGSSSSGGLTPSGTPGQPAGLPFFSDGGEPNIDVNLAGGESPSYNVTYSIGGGPQVTKYHNEFPFTLVMANEFQDFTMFANDAGKTQSPLVTYTWFALFGV